MRDHAPDLVVPVDDTAAKLGVQEHEAEAVAALRLDLLGRAEDDLRGHVPQQYLADVVGDVAGIDTLVLDYLFEAARQLADDVRAKCGFVT